MNDQHPTIEVAQIVEGGDNVSHEISDYVYKKTVIKVILGLIIICSAYGLIVGLKGMLGMYIVFSFGFIYIIYIIYIIYFIFYLFFIVFQAVWIYLNWKLYEAISIRGHEEVDKWIKLGITAYIIYFVVSIIFFIIMGSYSDIFGIVIGAAITALWFWYVQQFQLLTKHLEESKVELPHW